MAVALVAPDGRADPLTEQYSDYEQETLELALERHGAALDPAPQGKRIVGIEIDVLDVIEERDPAPNFLNIFHANTRDHIIAQELLFREGDTYDSRPVNESERNLRALRQESLVIIAPLQTGDPETVRVLVIAKDIWSLRLNSNYRLTGGEDGGLELLLLQPAEENLAGTHRRLLGSFVYEPDTISAGARFIDPRLWGSRVQWTANANVIVNHATGALEGGYGSFQYGVPLYSTSQKWAWSASVSADKEIFRRFVGTKVRTYDAVVTPERDSVPFIYDAEHISGNVSVTRSFGSDVKHDFTFSAGVSRAAYHPEEGPDPLFGVVPRDDLIDPAAQAEFNREQIPRSETQNGPVLQYHLYLNEFASLLDVETMSLQESFVMGPEAYVGFYPVLQAFGSTRDFFGWHGALAYTHRLDTGFFRTYLAATVETELRDEGGVGVSDAYAQAGVRVVTPSFVVGRLIFDGTAYQRLENHARALLRLGGDGRLRGYPTGLFLGENLVASNVEYRSRALQLWTVMLSGALYYDVGDAYDGTDLRLKQGAGFGLRILFPQLERSVLRVDWGFALTPYCVSGLAPPCDAALGDALVPLFGRPFDGLVFTFSQAFGVPRPTGGVVSIAP